MSNRSKASHENVQSRSAILCMEILERRDVPSASVTLDLTTSAAVGTLNGAFFAQANARPTGTGVIDSFVRVQALGNSTVEEGYNTSARPLAYNENKSPQFTRSLAVADTPVWIDPVSGSRYREFLLDINQKASAPLLSLDELKIFVANSPNLSGTLQTLEQNATLKYDMDAGCDAVVKLNARLSTGSGSGDMVLRIPESQLVGGTYLYLYSKFGATGGTYAANGGFEEWAVQGPGGGTIQNTTDPARLTGRVGFFNPDSNSPENGGITVQLLNSSGAVIDETVTVEVGEFGVYEFNNVLLDGEGVTQFTIRIISPSGTIFDIENLYLAPGDDIDLGFLGLN